LKDKRRNPPFHIKTRFSLLFSGAIAKSFPVTVLTSREKARKPKTRPLYQITITLSFIPIKASTGAPIAKNRK
jgi:hypothetical protein